MTTDTRGAAVTGWRRRASQRAIEVTRLHPGSIVPSDGGEDPFGRMSVPIHPS
jgi:hypothetical protein